MQTQALNSLQESRPNQDSDSFFPEGVCARQLKKFYVSCIKVETENQEERLKETLRGLVNYIFFIVLLCITALNTISMHTFRFNRIMTRLFLDSEDANGRTFREVFEIEDFWEFSKGPLLDGLYWDTWYNDDDLDAHSQNLTGYILYQNKVLGTAKIRQLRVKSEPCMVNKRIKLILERRCYPSYSQNAEDHAPFGPGVRDENLTAWNFHDDEYNKDFWYWGAIQNYGGGGFVQTLPETKAEAHKVIEELQESDWITRGSRAVFISFTVYNANINLFCVVRLSVEFPATGGAIPTWSFISIRLFAEIAELDILLLIVKVAFVVYIVFFAFQEIVQMYFEGLEYFKEFWNVFDNLLIVSCMVCIGLTVFRDWFVKNIPVEDLIENTTNMNTLAFIEENVLNFIAITLFVAFIKVFKYISFNKTMAQLSNTLTSCAKDLLGFFIMFFIVFLAFTQLGYLFFGSQTPEFSTFMNSFFTLFRIILGDFNFNQLEQANRILGPIFFLLFVFFVFFVLINMFLAIINDTYSEVKSDTSKFTEQIVMSDYIKTNFNACMDRIKGKKEGGDTEDAEEKLDKEQLKVEDWKIDLGKKGFKPKDIDAVIVKYGIEPDGYIDSAGQQLLLDELERQRAADLQMMEMTEDKDDISFEKEAESEDDEFDNQEFLKYHDFVNLFRKVERLEASLKNLFYKAETVMGVMKRRKKARIF